MDRDAIISPNQSRHAVGKPTVSVNDVVYDRTHYSEKRVTRLTTIDGVCEVFNAMRSAKISRLAVESYSVSLYIMYIVHVYHSRVFCNYMYTNVRLVLCAALRIGPEHANKGKSFK